MDFSDKAVDAGKRSMFDKQRLVAVSNALVKQIAALPVSDENERLEVVITCLASMCSGIHTYVEGFDLNTNLSLGVYLKDRICADLQKSMDAGVALAKTGNLPKVG